MSKTHIVSLSCILILLISGCAKDYRETIKTTEDQFYQGQTLEAARTMIPLINKRGKDQLLFMMEAGYMLHIAEKYQDSNKILLKAANIAQVKPISVSKQLSALMTNQTKTNYRGEDFEKVLIHMYAGINFLKLKEFESAAVEFKAVNNELKKIKTENGEAMYKQNIMAKYLAAIAHETLADLEDSEEDREYAEVEYRQILKLKPNLSMAKSDMKLLQVEKKNIGELVVIFQSGRGPVKVSRGKLLSDPGMNASVTIAISTSSLAAGVTVAAIMGTLATAENPIPKFIRRSNNTSHLKVSVMNSSITTTTLENIEYTAIKNLDDNYGNLRDKVAASIVVKAITSIAAGIAAKEITKSLSDDNALSSFIGIVAGAGTGAALFSQMKPDLRCWHTLPANLQLGRMILQPGKYTVNIQYIGHNGAIQKSKQINVDIKKKEKTFINVRTFD